MSTVTLALYKPHRWYDIGGRLICWWTASPYSHCELVIDGLSYSSSIRDGGVRAKAITFDPLHWDFIKLPRASAATALELHAQTAGDPYGWLDLLLRQVLRKRGNSDGWFCSEWCAFALGIPRGNEMSPGDLADYCRAWNL